MSKSLILFMLYLFVNKSNDISFRNELYLFIILIEIVVKKFNICFICSKLLSLLFEIFFNFSIISFLFLIFSFSVFNIFNIKDSSFISFWNIIFLSSLSFVYLIKFVIYELLIPPNLLH